jgi:hypothetical protein
MNSRALNSMNKGKSPGWDGIAPEVYSKCFNQLQPLLLKIINTAVCKGSFGSDVTTAITLCVFPYF